MSNTCLAFLLLAATCALVKANGMYFYYPGLSSSAYALSDPSVPYQIVMPSYSMAPNCDKEKKEGSESSGGEGGSSESKGEKEKEDSSSSSSSEESKPEGESKSAEEVETKESSDSSSESSSSESSSSEAAESNKVKSGSALFPPRTYTFPPRSMQQLVYTSPYYPSSYSLIQPYTYPIRPYGYYAAPAARVISSSAVSSKMASAPVVYSAPSTNLLPAMSKSYSINPGARVFPTSWNTAAMGYTFYKR